jgi:hypothetical protein
MMTRWFTYRLDRGVKISLVRLAIVGATASGILIFVLDTKKTMYYL